MAVKSLVNKKSLLDNISPEMLEKMIPCFRPLIKSYNKDETIMQYSGFEDKRHIAVVYKGKARLDVLDVNGEVFGLETYGKGDIFGELFTLPVDSNEYIITADENCSILYLDYNHVIAPCKQLCSFHIQMISNLFIMTAQKSQELSFHLSVLNKHSIREKLLYYLRYIRIATGETSNGEFEIPITLSKLADYLCVDRSAMMRELKSLKNEGLIYSNQRTFSLNF